MSKEKLKPLTTFKKSRLDKLMEKWDSCSQMQRNSPSPLPNIYFTEVITSWKITCEAHKKTVHGRIVVLAVAAIRENYWIPKLQQIASRVIRNCLGCKRFCTKQCSTQQQDILPSDRTTGIRPFQVIGADFSGPIMYCNKNVGVKKTYILLFKCSLTREIHLELLPNQTTVEHTRALKRLIARRGCPETIYWNNPKNKVIASKGIEEINKSELFHHVLSTRCIKWKFKLSKTFLDGVNSLSEWLVWWKIYCIKQLGSQI